jgi:hypothetical protein
MRRSRKEAPATTTRYKHEFGRPRIMKWEANVLLLQRTVIRCYASVSPQIMRRYTTSHASSHTGAKNDKKVLPCHDCGKLGMLWRERDNKRTRKRRENVEGEDVMRRMGEGGRGNKEVARPKDR